MFTKLVFQDLLIHLNVRIFFVALRLLKIPAKLDIGSNFLYLPDRESRLKDLAAEGSAHPAARLTFLITRT